jgi:hypothetical protein
LSGNTKLGSSEVSRALKFKTWGFPSQVEQCPGHHSSAGLKPQMGLFRHNVGYNVTVVYMVRYRYMV